MLNLSAELGPRTRSKSKIIHIGAVPSGADFTIMYRGSPKPGREYGGAALFSYQGVMQIASTTAKAK